MNAIINISNATVDTSSLAEKAMLVSLNMGSWSARKYDAEASEVAARHFGADTNGAAGRFNKILIAEEAMRSVVKIDGKIRTLHYRLTLPWSDNNQRVILNEGYAEYADGMRGLFTEREKVVATLVKNYPDLVEEARGRLGRMHKADEYPPVEELERRFYASFSVFPIPNAEDFRVKLAGNEVKKIRADIEASIRASLGNAMSDFLDQFHKVVSHMADKLLTYTPVQKPKARKSKKPANGKPKKRKAPVRAEGDFRESLIDNVIDMVQRAERLNITDDPVIEKIRQEMDKHLTSYSMAELKSDDKIRAKVAGHALKIQTDIEEAMAGYMG